MESDEVEKKSLEEVSGRVDRGMGEVTRERKVEEGLAQETMSKDLKPFFPKLIAIYFIITNIFKLFLFTFF